MMRALMTCLHECVRLLVDVQQLTLLVVLWTHMRMLATCHPCVYHQKEHNHARHSTDNPSVHACRD